MVYYDNSFERDDDVGVLSMSVIGSWRRKGLTILLSVILLLLAVFVVIVLFNIMYSESSSATETEEVVAQQVWIASLTHFVLKFSFQVEK